MTEAEVILRKSEKGVRHCEKNVNRGKPMCSQCLTPLVLLKWVLT